ncbi:unnamed protein product [Rotaria magnacalcarata]|uniref:Helix-turn-helix domain-containing protein n=2 Tax=Rotaria magnacalcarata TaxID=392030 RepID=A0A816QSJ1_9BILA|nr:unnamed protein product [Rotaria magnacalcarata]
MLSLNSSDHHFIRKFYDLKPNEEQVEILRKRIFLQRLPSRIDKIINQTIEPIELLLSNSTINKDQRASLISSCSKTITQYKFDLMSLNLNIMENIKRDHQQSLKDLQLKLIISNHDETSIEVIKAGQIAMRKRHHPSASTPFIEVNLKLTRAQMSMLMNGFKYITPCQSRFSRKSIDQIITEQYQKISSIVKDCQNDHRIPLHNERAKKSFSVLESIFNHCQSQKVPEKLQRRAQHENKIIRSIKRLTCRRSDIVRKAEDYMSKTEAYQEITDGRCPLADNLTAVQTLLNYLIKTNALSKNQANQLCQKSDKLELGHYHGLPKPHKPGTPLGPIIACIHAPATLISKFLNDLLAPIYFKVAREYTFINDIDVIRKLEKHAADGHITSTTKFITSDIENLYTMIPRDGALHALARFCIKHSKQGKIGTFTIDHVMRMARLILDTNCFAYNNKYYRQIRRGAMGTAFTQVLANIYLFEWEQELIQHQEKHNGIYGRYIDDIFMSTNQTIEEINFELEKAQNKDINIKIESTISTSVHFLDVTITNENGQLRTSIYHKPTTEPHILPFTSDHPHHIHRNIPYEALIRAVRICSNVQDFHSICICLDMSLLLNKYPPKFITQQFKRFINFTNAPKIFKQSNQRVYQRLHQALLQQTTRGEKKLYHMTRNPVEQPSVLQPKIWNKELMYPRYRYDSKLTRNFPK